MGVATRFTTVRAATKGHTLESNTIANQGVKCVDAALRKDMSETHGGVSEKGDWGTTSYKHTSHKVVDPMPSANQ